MVRIIEPKVELVTEIDAQKIMQNIETAARNCYKTENKDAEKMCRMLLEKHHEAMIEFSGDIDFLVTTDIGAQRDFSRHRHISMACESSRYCEYSKDKFGNQITVVKPCNMEDLTEWRQCMEDVERHYMNFQGTPDQKRLMLSLSTACTFHISANLREWRHILRLRASKAAHPSVQWVANQILDIFRAKGLGLFFDDLEL